MMVKYHHLDFDEEKMEKQKEDEEICDKEDF